MRLVRLKTFNGVPLAVNADAVAHVQASGDQATISFCGGGTLIVAQSFEEVLKLLADGGSPLAGRD